MQTALFHCVLGMAGSNIPVRNVTPAEFVCLKANHGNNAGKSIIEPGSFKITGQKGVVLEKDKDGKATKIGAFPEIVEYKRLADRYGRKLLAKLYPGDNPKLPQTFAEVGVGSDGKMLVKPQETVEVTGPGGKIETVVVPEGSAFVAPRTDGTRTDPGNPDNMALKVETSLEGTIHGEGAQ